MDNVVIVGIDEYKELLTLKVKTEVEALCNVRIKELEEKIAGLEEELDSQRECTHYWYSESKDLKEQLEKLKEGGES